MTQSIDQIVGAGQFRYRALTSWPQLPPGQILDDVAGVAVGADDQVFVFHRGPNPVLAFNRDGRLITAWGDGLFKRPHGIAVGPDQSLWLTDDVGHAVRKFTPDGRLLLTLGNPGQASDTGVQGMDYRTIRHGGPPFNYPTNLAFAADGSLLITDGYGNARVHHFAPDGRLLASWGQPGTGPGQFQIPHGIALDRAGRVYVADRENSRIQVFTPDGEFISEWNNVARPMQVCVDADEHVFVVEVGWRAGVWPWQTPAPDAPLSARLSVFDTDGNLQARWGDGEDPCAVGAFFAPHDICVDRHGDLYVGEVVAAAGGNKGLVSLDCHRLQKFVRI